MDGLATFLGVFAGILFGLTIGVRLAAKSLELDLVDMTVLIVSKLMRRDEQ